MAFTAGLKAPKQIRNNNSNQYQNTFDRLVTVKEYDLSKAYMYAEDDKGKKYEIFVNPEEVLRATEAAKLKGGDSIANWMGHSIDEKMKKAIPTGQKVVLTRSQIKQVDKTRDMSITQVHRIVGVPNPKADKTFQGLFTMSYRPDEGKERIARVQHWNPVSIDINDTAGLNKLKEDIDKARANFGKKIGEYTVTEPTIGVQFRALVRTDKEYEWATDPSKKAIYEVVDMSLPFDWIPGPEGADGKEIKSEAHPLKGEEMLSFAELYINYITSHESFKDNLDDMKVEVTYYHLYPASKNNNLLLTSGVPEKDKNADKNPLYQLSHHKSFIDLAQTEALVGRNAAVNGIIQISDNKVVEDADGNLVKVPSYWVSKVHANNIRGHIHSFIRTADGHKAKPHPKLDLIKKQGGASTQVNPDSSSVEHHEPVAAPSAHVHSQPQAVENDFDPFAGSDFSDPFASSETSGTSFPRFNSNKE